MERRGRIRAPTRGRYKRAPPHNAVVGCAVCIRESQHCQGARTEIACVRSFRDKKCAASVGSSCNLYLRRKLDHTTSVQNGLKPLLFSINRWTAPSSRSAKAVFDCYGPKFHPNQEPVPNLFRTFLPVYVAYMTHYQSHFSWPYRTCHTKTSTSCLNM